MLEVAISFHCFSRRSMRKFAPHTTSMLRVRDANSFRGDVSEKLQVRSASSHYSFLRMKSNLFIRTLPACCSRLVKDDLFLIELAL